MRKIRFYLDTYTRVYVCTYVGLSTSFSLELAALIGNRYYQIEISSHSIHVPSLSQNYHMKLDTMLRLYSRKWYACEYASVFRPELKKMEKWWAKETNNISGNKKTERTENI